MDTIKIDKIIVKDNVRTDYGNIEEFAAVILENGIKPLELERNYELVDGHRRLRAIEYINSRKDIPEDKKIWEVRFFYSDEKIEKEISQMVAGLHQKNLTPLENAKAYAKYLNKPQRSKESLAKKLGKKVDYVERRLLLLKLCEPVEKALQDKKIEVGHAQLLSQMNEKQQKNALKEILEWDLTVQNFADQIRWMKKIDFGNIEFRPDNNGNNQKTIFDSIGNELNPKHNDADFRNSTAFKKDLAQYVESERKVLRSKGIKVFNSDEVLQEKFPEAKAVESYGDNYTNVLKELPGSKKYAVVVDIGYNDLDKTVYLLDPQVEKKKEQEAKKAKQREFTPEEKAEAEKNLNLSRKEKLKRRIDEFKTEFLIEKSRELLEPGFNVKALILWQLMNDNCGNEYTDKAMKSVGISNHNYVEKILKLPEDKLDKALSVMAKITLAKMDLSDLSCVSQKIGVKYNRHFVMNEEYLKPYTKDALRKLGRELKISLDGIEKASDMKVAVVKNWKAGQVPKALAA